MLEGEEERTERISNHSEFSENCDGLTMFILFTCITAVFTADNFNVTINVHLPKLSNMQVAPDGKV